MNFNDHSDLAGRHAFLSPSNYHWINYNDQKLESRFISSMAAQKGSELHAFAQEAIRLGINLPKSQKTLNMYVNDAIGYKMQPEVALFYSTNCFGHADAVSFRKNKLRIHDLKTGIIPVKFHQLEIYAALFCLEYGISPFDIEIELRIYQRDEIMFHEPFAETIMDIMDKIILFDRQIEELKLGGAW